MEATKERAHTIRQERPENIRGTSAEIWEAHHNAKTAAQFQKHLTNCAKVMGKQGLALAVVSEGDQPLTPNIARGSFVVVDQKGYVYELNQKTTGRSAEGAQQFMRASLDPAKFASVTAVRSLQISKMQQIRATEALTRNDRSIAWGRGERPTTVRSVASGAKFGAKRVVAQTKATIAPVKVLKAPAQSIGNILGGLFSALVPDPPKTPKQIAYIEKKAEQNEIQWSKFVYDTDHDRAIASQQDQARYRQQEADNWKKDRDRDGRDR